MDIVLREGDFDSKAAHLAEYLTCSICHEVKTSWLVLPCQHEFCTSCSNTVLGGSQQECPECRRNCTKNDLKPCLVKNRLAQELPLRCNGNGRLNGCTWEGNLASRAAHVSTCSFQYVIVDLTEAEGSRIPAAEMPLQKVFVRDQEGVTFTVETSRGDTVRSVKDKIASIKSIAAESQRLLFAGKELSDGKKMSEYAIRDSSVLLLCRKIAGKSAQLFLKNLRGKTVVIEICLQAPVHALKLEIERLENIKPSEQTLTACGKPLHEDDRSLSSYGLQNNSIVFLTCRLKGGTDNL
eukprot:Rmarinus@m.10697